MSASSTGPVKQPFIGSSGAGGSAQVRVVRSSESDSSRGPAGDALRRVPAPS